MWTQQGHNAQVTTCDFSTRWDITSRPIPMISATTCTGEVRTAIMT